MPDYYKKAMEKLNIKEWNLKQNYLTFWYKKEPFTICLPLIFIRTCKNPIDEIIKIIEMRLNWNDAKNL